MSYVLIVGAKSDIARAIAREYARHGYDIYLAARNSESLVLFANDLSIRYHCDVKVLELDILDYRTHREFYSQLPEQPEGVISAVGYMGDQEQAQQNFSEAEKIMASNYTGIVSLLNLIAEDFSQRKSGFIIGISSVAGDRGRKTNYIYGSAKAALTAYLSGLRNRLFADNVKVLTVKPGFVNTRMTKHMNLPERLTAEPEQVAHDVFMAQSKGKDVVYTLWFWKYIMLIIKIIPEFQFKKMSL